MENVTIVGTEDDLLILATGSGERFALAIDDVLQREIRRARRRDSDDAPRVMASPREIQAHIRSGLSAVEVAELLGIGVDDVARFEGPVLAEREHIIGQALAVPVLIGSEVEPDAQPTFGVAIHAKLADLQASAERWASWKDESGWIVKLEFDANEVSHDARWSFDPRRSALSPLNADATQLSRQGSLPEGLIPRLRAVDSDRTESPYKDDSRFDSGAFGPRLLPALEADVEEPLPPERSNAAAQAAAIKRAPDESVTSAETADLLEALRRRRGQRESAPLLDDEFSEQHDRAEESGPIALFESLEPEYVEQKPKRTPDPAPQDSANDTSGRRRRRNAMPSWDEIVFGARTDD
ncbi:septation protein SepH [Microbacterium murale]|uniref:DNA-binding protein n=1 Tax=Microbacterium murale TaxID=1081040 RepID=A0ABQ1RSG9_9MICO|nr:septation protein SepH [Microbacterium murale]GGD77837.1 DNA-binding protein [Microbacterium murale]